MIVGLTGGIGTGKSTVAKLFEVLGCPVYNSDDRAKAVYYDPEIKQQITSLLGENAYDQRGKIDRQFISGKIFNDKELLQKVNAVIHPAVGKDFMAFLIKHSESKIIIKESALLFEAGLKEKVNKIILVTAPMDVRIERIMKRDAHTKEQILSRISHQLPDETKIPQSDFVIVNDGEQAVIPQVLKIYDTLLNA
jgi:dephospho-CoA kinase